MSNYNRSGISRKQLASGLETKFHKPYTTATVIFTLILLIGCTVRVCGQITTISGRIDNLKIDTVKLVLLKDNIVRQSETHYKPVSNGQFTDTLQITKPVYFYLNDGSNYVNGIIEPGDRITIQYDATSTNSSLKFSGKGHEKVSFLNFLVRLKLYNRIKEQLPIAKTKQYPFDFLLNYADSTGIAMSYKLDSIKNSMTSVAYQLLSADIKATVMGNKYRSIGLIYHESVSETLQKRQHELTESAKLYLQNILHFDNSLYYSSSYINEVYNILFMDHDGLVLAGKTSKNLLDKYAYLSRILPDGLNVPVLTLFMEYDIGKLNQAEDIDFLIHKLYSSPKDSVYRSYIEAKYNNAMSFKRGMSAPDFTVENQQGKKITLTSFKGKVVYIDFWYAACGPCHALFKTIEPVKKHFSSKDEVIFLNISIDRKETWNSALEKYKIQGYHVFTENREANHPAVKSYKVAGYPTTCLIDKNGNIYMANPSNNPDELKVQIEEALKIELN